MIPWKKFCAREEGRYAITLPWKGSDGLIYATDGKICIRAKETENIEVLDTSAIGAPRPPDAATLFVPILKRENKLKPITAKVEYTHNAKCFCVVKPECKECGQVIESAEEVPEDDCDECDGKGWYDKAKQVTIDGCLFAGKYIARLELLPNVLFHAEPDKAAYFTFDGGDGLLMPMREAERDE